MKQNRSGLFLGFLLILIGGWMVVTRQVPAIQEWINDHYIWPMWLIGSGLLILLIGLINGAPGMAVPASIVAGLGGIFYYQVTQNDYSSWSYMWALIPGFVGFGSILAGVLGEDTRRNLGHGLNLIVISAVMFLIFASFLGGLDILGDYGAAVILILAGAYILIRGFVRSGGKNAEG